MKGFVLKSLRFLFKKPSGSGSGSRLICTSSHNTVICSDLTVVIDGKSYLVLHETATSVNDLSIGMICKSFQNKCPYQVRLSFNYGQESMQGFICFNNIPQISPFSGGCFLQQLQPMDFTVHLFDRNLIKFRFLKKLDRDTPSFALGFFNYHDFIKQLKRMVNLSPNEQISDLLKKISHSLLKIGYFDIFDINHFQSIVLMIFLRMFNRQENIWGRDVLRNLFFSLIQQFFSNNCWFMIVGDKYRAIQGRPSSTLIELFSNPKCLPTVNFVSNGFVGLVTQRPDVCILVSVSRKKIEVCEIGLLHYYYHGGIKSQGVVDVISNALFGPQIDTDDQHEELDISCVPRGVLTDFRKSFKIFVFKDGNFFNVFIRKDERFEWFCPYFFLMLHLFAVNDIHIQLTNHFQNFFSIEREELVEALVRNCGFESIFDGSAKTEQIHEFFFKSDFGILLQHIIHDFGGFPERLRECCSKEDGSRRIKFLQENQYVSHLRIIFEKILEKLQGRSDLSQEIQQILSSLDQIVKFLKPVPPHSE